MRTYLKKAYYAGLHNEKVFYLKRENLKPHNCSNQPWWMEELESSRLPLDSLSLAFSFATSHIMRRKALGKELMRVINTDNCVLTLILFLERAQDGALYGFVQNIVDEER